MEDFGSDRFETRSGTSDRAILEEVVERRTYLKSFILPFIKRNGIIIDIGAHIGSFTIQSCALLKPRVVIAIEPDRSSYGYLVRNITKAKLGHLVHPIEMAIWNSSTETNLCCRRRDPATSSIIPSWRQLVDKIQSRTVSDVSEIYRIRADTLDNVLRMLRLGNAKIELIKIDVEGSEEQVLEGSVHALRRCNIIVGELHEALLPEDKFRELMKNFFVVIGEPFTSARVHSFWAVKKTLFRNRATLEEFRRAAHVADIQDAIWKAEQQEDAMLSLRMQVDAIRSSFSWKMTAPIRWLGSRVLLKRETQTNKE